MSKKVVAIGELLVDSVKKSDGKIYHNAGGAPANFLSTLALLNADTAMIGTVGDDRYGDLILVTLNDVNIDKSCVRVDDTYKTTRTIVNIDQNGDRSFKFLRNFTADTQIYYEQIDEKLIENCDILHFGTLSLTKSPSLIVTKKVIEHAKEKGKIISFDPNYREEVWEALRDAKEMMLYGLEKADIVKMSKEEVELLFSDDLDYELERIYKEYNLKLFVITLGEKGSMYISNKGKAKIDALENVKVVDTTGAGDIFFGSLIYKILSCDKKIEDLSKEEIDNAVSFATMIAGLSTEKYGGISSVISILGHVNDEENLLVKN